jgi:hypothetical protein
VFLAPAIAESAKSEDDEHGDQNDEPDHYGLFSSGIGTAGTGSAFDDGRAAVASGAGAAEAAPARPENDREHEPDRTHHGPG